MLKPKPESLDVSDMVDQEARPSSLLTFDDDGSEVRNPTVWHVAHGAQQEKEIQLDVHEGLANLVTLFHPMSATVNVGLNVSPTYLQVFVFNTSLVTTQSLNGNSLFSIIEEFGCDWRVGHEDADDDTPNTTQGTDDDEFISPRGESSLDVANGIAKQSSESDAQSICGVPQPNAEGLFSTSIPLYSISSNVGEREGENEPSE